MPTEPVPIAAPASASTDVYFPEPSSLGLPAKFASWRPSQLTAFEFWMGFPSRFLGFIMPVGSGKSGVYVGWRMFGQQRMVILCSTKALQNQLLEDFAGCGMVDVRGRSNFDCLEYQGSTCEDAAGFCGHHRTPTCPYWHQYQTARNSKLVVTNYAYWMSVSAYSEGLGDVDILVMDEAQDAADTLCSTVGFHLTRTDIRRVIDEPLPTDVSDINEWHEWACKILPDLNAQIVALDGEMKTQPTVTLSRQLRNARRLATGLTRFTQRSSPWVVEVVKTGDGGFRFDPVWPDQYAESFLFRRIDQIALFSSTITEATFDNLGIASSDRTLLDIPSDFPVVNSPVIINPKVRVNYRMTEEAIRTWVSIMDDIIERRLDRKGIIHTISYDRAQNIVSRSRFGARMISHRPGSDNLHRAIEEFRGSGPGVVLVSPVVTTGYDFPYQDCEYQIIAKLPYPTTNSRLMEERTGKNYPRYSPEAVRGEIYLNSLISSTLEQMVGRGCRADDDKCETFIVDNMMKFFLTRYRHLFHRWFRDRCRYVQQIPAPPPPLVNLKPQP